MISTMNFPIHQHCRKQWTIFYFIKLNSDSENIYWILYRCITIAKLYVEGFIKMHIWFWNNSDFKKRHMEETSWSKIFTIEVHDSRISMKLAKHDSLIMHNSHPDNIVYDITVTAHKDVSIQLSYSLIS